MPGPIIKKGIMVETIVDFIDPDVQFVSLVGHAANREPFTILKSNDGGKSMKTIVSVLIPKSLTKEQSDEILKEYNNADATEYDTYTKYQQVDESVIKADSYQLMYLNKESKVMAVVAEMKEDPAAGTEDPIVNKEKVDWATLDTVLEETYAFMDIMIGCLQQSGMEKEDRRSIILGALKNFETFLNTSFETLEAKELTKALNLPSLVVFSEALKVAKSDIPEDKPQEVAPAESKPKPVDTPPSDPPPAEDPPVDKSITMEEVQAIVSSAISSLELPAAPDITPVTEAVTATSELIKSTNECLEALKAELVTIKEDIDSLKAQPKTKSAHMPPEILLEQTRDKQPKEATFKGVFLSKS